MAEAIGSKNYFTFVKGLITDSSKLLPVEDSCTSIDNVDLGVDGSIKRRKGIDYEKGYSTVSTGHTEAELISESMSAHVWKNVNNSTDFDIVVVRVGSDLYFFNKASGAISANQLNSGAPLSLPNNSETMQSSSILGKFVFVLDTPGVYTLEYDETLDIVSIRTSLLRVRDIWGVDDGLALTEQPPAPLSITHEYNLINQGWAKKPILVSMPGTSGSSGVPYERYEQEIGNYPSNAQPMAQNHDTSGNLRVNPQLIFSTTYGDAPAPKGSVIMDVFRRGDCREEHYDDAENYIQSSISGYSTSLNDHYINGAIAANALLDDSSVGGVIGITPYAGRLAYIVKSLPVTDGDNRSPDINSMVFISQTVTSEDNLTACYQSADPTSQEISDLIATDGLSINIVGMNNPNRLVEFEDKLLVFAANGVWEISGGEENFSATSVVVRKVAEEGCVNPDSVVVSSNAVTYWGHSSIYVLAPDEIGRTLIARDLIHSRNKNLYDSINIFSKRYSKGMYDDKGLRVLWLYNDTETYEGGYFKKRYNKILAYDLSLDSYYQYTIGEVLGDTPFIADIIPRATITTNLATTDVVDNFGTLVVDSKGQQVVTVKSITTPSDADSSFSMLTIVPGATLSMTFSNMNNDDFIDWETFDGTGVDAAASFTTYSEVLDEAAKNKQIIYINCFFRPVETAVILDGNNELTFEREGSCLMQAHWDWAVASKVNKISPARQVYRLNSLFLFSQVEDPFEYGYDMVETKNKLRGRGKSVALKFSSEPGKDLHMYGWSVKYSGNTAI